MGLFDSFFGKKAAATQQAAAQPDALQGEQELLEAVAAGDSGDLVEVLETLDDEEGFALLMTLLPASTGHARVDIIDNLAEFELDAAQQRTVVGAAVRDVPGAAWTAASVALGCDLGALCDSLEPQASADLQLFDDIGELLTSLLEVTLTTGPAGTAADAPASAAHVEAWAGAVQCFGARPADLVGLAMAQQLGLQGDNDEELCAIGFNAEFAQRLRAVKEAVLGAGSRGGPWQDALPALIRGASLPDALVALQAAAISKVAIRDALLERVDAAPDDEPTWDLALAAGVDERLLNSLAPVAVATLQWRRQSQDELCSPASQVGCLKCGGGSPAEDGDLMIPRALRDRLLPLLVATKSVPGACAELLIECLAAPDPSLRYHALLAFSGWRAESVPAPARDIVDMLADDSMPAVQNQALELQRSWA